MSIVSGIVCNNIKHASFTIRIETKNKENKSKNDETCGNQIEF